MTIQLRKRSRNRRAFGFAAAAVITLSVIGPKARAADPPLSKERQLEICIASFEEAQLKQKRGKVVFAKKLFTDCSAQVCPRPLRDDCAERAISIDKAIPTVTFAVRDASGKDIDNAQLKIDGEPFQRTPGIASPIDPGQHDVDIVVGDAPAVKTKITIAEGEKSRVVVLDYKTTATTSSTSGAPPTTTTTPSSGPAIVGPAIAGGLGVLSLIAATGLILNASSQDDKAFELRTGSAGKPAIEAAAMNESAASHAAAAENNQRLGFVVGAMGLVCIGIGVAWYLISLPPSAAEKKSAWRGSSFVLDF